MVIEKLEFTVVEHFYNKESIGFLNQLEHLNLRIKIAEERLECYYLNWNGKNISITDNGELTDNPSQLYPELSDAWTKLLTQQQINLRKSRSNSFYINNVNV